MSTRSLSDIRVLEIGEMVAAPYAAKLLADLGAHVIKIEPIGGDRSRRSGPFPPDADGDPEQSGLFLGLNTNKQSVELDLASEQGQIRIAQLLGDCDIYIHSLSAERARALGLDAVSLQAKHPSLVICALTPYGSTGPHADWLGEEVNVVHGGGWGNLIPGDAPDLTTPPLTVFGHPANCQAAMAAALVSLGSFYKADETGVGEYIDFSAMAHVSSMLEASFIAWSYMGKVAARSEGRLLNPWGIYQCNDGLIFLVTVEQDQWERLVDMMGRPEWATLEIFATMTDRAANRDVLNIYLNEWTSEHSTDDLFHRGQAERICFAPVFTMADLADQQHLRDRGFFTSATHEAAGEVEYMGAPYRMSPDLWRLDQAAPLLNEHPDATFTRIAAEPAGDHDGVRSRRPLEGVRVIDFSWVWAGPFCTMHLAYLGADVIKIESSQRPSLGRRLPVHPPEVEPTLNTSGYFNQWDQGKRSVELDLTDPASIDAVLQLIAGADVVVDNYATGVMDRLGLGDDTLRAVNPNLIIASVTGFGHDGPLAKYMGYGPTTAPLSGLTSMTGHLGGPPEEAGISLGDPAAGLTAAFTIMASLLERRAGSGGRRIDISLWEATATNAVELWMAHALGSPPLERMGSRTPWAAPHGVFRCAGDDNWISIACVGNEQWTELASLIGDTAGSAAFETLDARKTNEAELEAVVSAFTESHDRWQLAELLQSRGIAAYPSLTCPDIEQNEQLTSRGFWEHFAHPEVGSRAHSGVPWRTANTVNGVPGRAPLLGEHTAEILGQ